jgi:DNA-binding transcriptional LysR family regulator
VVLNLSGQGCMISYQDLLYFIELTKTLNFSRAAERCGITQPSFSAAIKRLEAFVGTELFIRDKHKVLLTQSGKNLLAHSKQLLELWETTKTSCVQAYNTVQGSITLGCHLSLALYFLPTFLPTLLTQYPDLDIHLKHDVSRKITEGVINFSIDIGIAVNPIRHPNLIIKRLFSDEVACWHATTLTDINHQENILICDPELPQTQFILKKLNALNIRYKRIIKNSNLEMIANLTAAGAGIGILPSRVMTSLHHNNVKILDNAPTFKDEISLIYRHENTNTNAVREVARRIQNIV